MCSLGVEVPGMLYTPSKAEEVDPFTRSRNKFTCRFAQPFRGQALEDQRVQSSCDSPLLAQREDLL